MKKAFLTTFFILLLLFFTLPFFYILSPSTNSQIPDSDEGIVYMLPYPGILPDHPLYFLKAARDKITEFAIRDNTEKAKHYLLLSDKRAAMAVALSRRGKNQQAISTFSKGEKYALKIPELLTETKKQGGAYTDGFLNDLKQSNLKHREMLDILLKDMPQGESQ